MSAVIEFPQRSIVGKHIKVSRHGEALWLKVRRDIGNGKLVSVVDSVPVIWPEKLGDKVIVDWSEVCRIYGDEGPET